MVTAKSCPAPKSHLHEEEEKDDPPRFACLLGRLPADAPAKAHQLAVRYLPNPSPDALPAYVCPDRLAVDVQTTDHLLAEPCPDGSGGAGAELAPQLDPAPA